MMYPKLLTIAPVLIVLLIGCGGSSPIDAHDARAPEVEPPDIQATVQAAVSDALEEQASRVDLKATIDAAVETAVEVRISDLASTLAYQSPPSPTPTPIATALPTPSPTATPAPARRFYFNGAGDQNTETFTITTSPWTLKWRTYGECVESMTISLGDPRTGRAWEYLVTQDASLPTTETTLIYARIGTYYLDIDGPVEACGGWAIEIAGDA